MENPSRDIVEESMTMLSGRLSLIVAMSLFAAISSGCGAANDAPPGSQVSSKGKPGPAADKNDNAVADGKSLASGESDTTTTDDKDPSPNDANVAPSNDPPGVGGLRHPVARQNAKPKQEIVDAQLPDDPDLL